MGDSFPDSDWLAADWPAPSCVVAGTTLRHAEADRLPVTGNPIWLRQVHGATVVAAAADVTYPDADGAVSRDTDTVCVVRTADCLPVLFCSTDGRVRAAAHAGWRGLAAGVLENTVAAMATDPANIITWLGPAISQPCFEVGDEVRQVYVDHDQAAGAAFERNARGRWQADLMLLAKQRLASVGVSAVYGGGECTFTSADNYFSYRRNPECGRLLSFVALRNP